MIKRNKETVARLSKKLSCLLVASLISTTFLISCSGGTGGAEVDESKQIEDKNNTEEKEEISNIKFEDVKWLDADYMAINDFSSGRARAVVANSANSLERIIDIEGNVIFEYDVSKYNIVGKFIDNRAYVVPMVYENIPLGYIDEDGKEIVPLKYKYGNINPDFSDGLAAVQSTDNNKFGYIDKEGNVVIDFKYDNAGYFCDGLAPVALNGQMGFIDKQGNTAIPFDNRLSASMYEDNLAAVQDLDGQYVFINKSGEKVINDSFEEIRIYPEETGFKLIKNGYVVVKKNGKYGLIDTKGNIVLDMQYDDLDPFIEDLALAKKNNKYGFLDKDKNIAIPFEYDDAWSFRNGLAKVQIIKNSIPKYGFVDKNGKQIIAVEYDEATSFYNGKAFVKKDGRWGILSIKK